MKRYDTYIFDLDGTLLDTIADLAVSTNAALAQFGMPQWPLSAIQGFVGNGVRKLMERAVPNGSGNPLFEECYAAFREYYAAHSLDKTQPYDGIMETLAELHRRGCRMAVVSNKMHSEVEHLCRHFFGAYIPVAIGNMEGLRTKPAPDTAEEALRQLGASKENAVYVGDSEVDIQTAANADLPCISVAWGFKTRQFLVEHGARTIIDKPSELVS